MKGIITIEFDDTWFDSDSIERWFKNVATEEERREWLLEAMKEVLTVNDIVFKDTTVTAVVGGDG